MSTVLVFAEYHGAQLKKGTLELLTAARESGMKVQALVLGSGAKAVVEQLGAQGAEDVLINSDPSFDRYNPEAYTSLFAEALGAQKPKVVLASSNSLGRDLFPRVAARLGAGVTSDCIEVSFSGDQVKARRPMYAGKCTAEVSFSNSPFAIVLMRPNQITVKASTGAKTPAVHEIGAGAAAKDLKTLIKDVVKGASEKLDLTEANIIVSGGRGLKEAANFKIVNDLAEVLGATVGASRAVVDAGWVPHTMQVGQTGKTVAPTLYIAIGISGAIQHLAGMSGSKVIVAINKDGGAPIFQKATYGLVGDAFEIVPLLTDEFRKILHH
jgi:electron transfer flavoprotein alpha subunit